MPQHYPHGLLVFFIACGLTAAPALANPEWIECTLDEITVTPSHIEISCSAVYAPTSPPSQAARAGSTVGGAQSVGGMTMVDQSMGKAPKTAQTGKASPAPAQARGGKAVSPSSGKVAAPQGKSLSGAGGKLGGLTAVVVHSAAPLPAEKNAIRFYAVPYSNTAAAAILQLLLAAQQTGFILQLKTDYTDISGVPIGCQERDCRLLQEARLFRASN